MTPRGPSPSASSETTQQGQYSCSNNSSQVAWSQVSILPPEQELLLREGRLPGLKVRPMIPSTSLVTCGFDSFLGQARVGVGGWGKARRLGREWSQEGRQDLG